MEKRTNTKMGLVGKILTGTVIALTSLGFESDAKQAYSQQPDYNISQRERERNDVFLGSILGGVLGSGVVGKGRGKVLSQGVGNGISNGARNLATMSSGDSTQVNVNVNPQPAYTPVYVPQTAVQQAQPVIPALEKAVLPEYNLSQLRAEYDIMRVNINPTSHLVTLLLPPSIRTMFTYSGYLDKNGDGKASFDEFIGVTRNPSINDPINLSVACDHGFGVKKLKVRYRTFDVNGNPLAETSDEFYNDKRTDTTFRKALKFDSPGVYHVQASIYTDSKPKPRDTKTISILVQ